MRGLRLKAPMRADREAIRIVGPRLPAPEAFVPAFAARRR